MAKHEVEALSVEAINGAIAIVHDANTLLMSRAMAEKHCEDIVRELKTASAQSEAIAAGLRMALDVIDLHVAQATASVERLPGALDRIRELALAHETGSGAQVEHGTLIDPDKLKDELRDQGLWTPDQVDALIDRVRPDGGEAWATILWEANRPLSWR